MIRITARVRVRFMARAKEEVRAWCLIFIFFPVIISQIAIFTFFNSVRTSVRIRVKVRIRILVNVMVRVRILCLSFVLSGSATLWCLSF